MSRDRLALLCCLAAYLPVIGCSYKDRPTVALLSSSGQLTVALYGSTVARRAPILLPAPSNLLRISLDEIAVAGVSGPGPARLLTCNLRNRQWTSTLLTNGEIVGHPSIAPHGQDTLLIAVHGGSHQYFLSHVTLTGNRPASPWFGLQGIFTSDPLLLNCNGRLLLAGLGVSGAFWSRTLPADSKTWAPAPWTRHPAEFIGQLAGTCLGSSYVVAARAPDSKIWTAVIQSDNQIQLTDTGESFTNSPQIIAASDGIWFAGRTEASAIRACRLDSTGRLAQGSCFTLSTPTAAFALTASPHGPRLAGLFSSGELRWWDWPDSEWQPSLMPPAEISGLHPEFRAY